MPESNASARETTTTFFEQQFGVPHCVLAALDVMERGGEIWVVARRPPAGIHSRRPPGLRALRWMPDGYKPTSTFLSALGDSIASARFELDFDTLRLLLHGRRIGVDLPDGYVALTFDDIVLGCGRVQRSTLHALLPTGRRQELLQVLGQVCASTASKV